MTKKPIALITGANKGLGKEVARQLSGLGMRVYLGCRHVERGQAAADELTREGANVMVLWDQTLDRRELEFSALITMAGWLRHRIYAGQSGRYIRWPSEDVPRCSIDAKSPTFRGNLQGSQICKRKNRPGYTEAVIDLCVNWLRGPESTETCVFRHRSARAELLLLRVELICLSSIATIGIGQEERCPHLVRDDERYQSMVQLRFLSATALTTERLRYQDGFPVATR
jgi:hypothetical protein